MLAARHHRLLTALIITILLSLLSFNLIQAAPSYTFHFIPDSSYSQGDTRVALHIIPGMSLPGASEDPVRVIWKDPLGNVVSYCASGNCGPIYDQSIGTNGSLLWREFYFYITGQYRLSGTYTAIVMHRVINGGVFYEQELFTTTFTISGGVTPPPDDVRDPDFGEDGIVLGDFESFLPHALIALQPDGKIVACGNGDSDIVVARFNSGGSLDPTFSQDGLVSTDLGTAYPYCNAVALQSDGKILVTGQSDQDLVLARYTPAGSLDTGFGSGGVVHTRMNDWNIGLAVVVQPDGKILVAGHSYDDGYTAGDFLLLRYNSNGSLDTAFGNGGAAIIAFATNYINDQATSIALQTDGKIVLTGESSRHLVLVRCLPDGSPDSSFGWDGIVYQTGFEAGEALALQPDGKIVVASSENYSGERYRFAVLRYNPDGSLDADFGAAGVATTTFDGAEPSSHARAVIVLGNGKIVAGGNHNPDGSLGYFALAQYLPDGSLDTAHETGGRMLTDVSSSRDYAYALALQPDGKVILAGRVASYQFAMVRYDLGTLFNLYIPVVSKSP